MTTIVDIDAERQGVELLNIGDAGDDFTSNSLNKKLHTPSFKENTSAASILSINRHVATQQLS